MAEIKITPVTGVNQEGLVALFETFATESPVYAGLEFDEAGAREFIDSYGPDNEYNMAFIAMLGDEVAGFLFVTIYKHPCMKGTCCCDELMYTRPDLRGAGIGGVLVEEYKGWAEARDIDLVLLGSSSGINTDFAEKFYAGHDFQPCGMLAKLGEPDVRRQDKPREHPV